MLPADRPATSWVHYTTSCNTQSSAPEDGRDPYPKHVELIGIINKPLLLHLFGVYIIYSTKGLDRSHREEWVLIAGYQDQLLFNTVPCAKE
jgi:hypothetical protein